MTAVPPCPDVKQWMQPLQQQASMEEIERLAEHLEHCSACAETVEVLMADSTLAEAMRAQAGRAPRPEGERVEGLIDQLRSLSPPVQAAEQQTTSGGCTSPAGGSPVESSAEALEERHEFLAPPQGPGEVGRLGSYRVLKVLGQGGMGIVFQAEDVQLKRPVALKVLKPQAAAKPASRERFLREAQSAARLEHEHIVTIYQVGEEGGVPFLAMQWLKGMSLEERLARPEPLSVSQALRLGKQIARGLEAAHGHGLVHRDIKPANLWIEPEHGGRVRILDFGLARAVEDQAHLTQSGVVVGTPGYMAPEQARGEKVDARCDLFSLGCVLYRMLTGRRAFTGRNALAVLASLAVDAPAAPAAVNATVPGALSELVMQLLAKQPQHRPQSAGEVVKRLGEIEEELTAAQTQPVPVAVPVVPPEPPNPWADLDLTEPAGPVPGSQPAGWRHFPRSAWLAAAVAVVVLLAVVPLGYFYGGTVVLWATNRGQVVLEVDDPDMEVTVRKGGVVIRDPKGKRVITLSAGEHDLEVTVKDADGEIRFRTGKFTLSRGGKKVIDVRQEVAKARRPKPPVVKDPDRRVAEWVLSLGGTVTVRVAEKEQEVRATRDLPTGAFQVVRIDLGGNEGVTDAGLEHLEALSNVEHLYLHNRRVSDAGLEHLKPLTNLTILDLGGARVSDAGLAHLKTLTKLERLYLNSTRVSDAGLKHLKTLTNLTILTLAGTQVSDAGLEHLKTLTKLTRLHLYGTRVSDAGLAHLEALSNLTDLDLSGTPVSDAGLVHLARLPKLASIGLLGTRVSAKGLAKLKETFPRAEVVWGDPDRRAAEWVLSIGGAVRTSAAKDQWIRATEDLPAGRFKVVMVEFAYNRQVTDAGLENLKGLTNIVYLNLSATRVTDAGLEHVKGLTSLQSLSLHHMVVGNAGLEHLEPLTNLTTLSLYNTRVSNAGLEHLEPLIKLTHLNLTNTRVSDPGLEHLKTLTNLTWLSLAGTRVSDAGLEHLKPLTKLTSLNLYGTRVSDAGLEHLKSLTNLTILHLGGTRVSDPGLEHLKPLTKLTSLDLYGTQVSDADLKPLAGLTHLRCLNLNGTQVSDADLEHLKPLTKLTSLNLTATEVSDTGLKHLKTLTNLNGLWLGNTRVSDAGLKHLYGLTHLRELDLTDTKVTATGAAALQKALPECKVHSGPASK